MFKYELIGSIHSTFKLKKDKVTYNIGLKNIYFLFYFLRKYLKLDITIKLNLIKLNNKTFCIRKAFFKYKISKHHLTLIKNKFIVDVTITNIKTNFFFFINFIKFIKNIGYLNSSIISINSVGCYFLIEKSGFFIK